MDKIEKIKGCNNLAFVKKRWVYELIEVEVLENLERLNREKEVKLNSQAKIIT